MRSSRSKQSGIVMALVMLLAVPVVSQAQELTADQQSAATSALCSAAGSKVSMGPSILQDPAVLNAATSIFASTTHLPIAQATTLLRTFAGEHASDILSSCAASNAAGSLPKIPSTGNLPSVPKWP